VLRFVLWRLLGVLSAVVGVAIVAWLLGGGPGRALRGEPARHGGGPGGTSLSGLALKAADGVAKSLPGPLIDLVLLALTVSLIAAGVVLVVRWRARSRRVYVRLRIEAYRADGAEAPDLARMFTALHGRLLQRWWRRIVAGQPSLALEVHHGRAGARDARAAWLALVCPRGQERMAEAALQVAYPNTQLSPTAEQPGRAPVVLRLKKRRNFIERTATANRVERAPEPPMNRLLTTLGACGQPAFVQFALTPTPAVFERLARRAYRQREDRISRQRREGLVATDRSVLLDTELRGGLEIQHRALFFADVRVVAATRAACEQIASVLRIQRGENQLVERATGIRHGVLGLYGRRVRRGEGNPIAGVRRSVFSAEELALLWQLPSTDYATVPFARSSLPLAPAPPGILRPTRGPGTLRDALGPVAIHVEMRRQNTAVPGTVEQGKSSYLVATIAEDLRRERCAVIVLDPKGDAAEAAVSSVPDSRRCTVLDFAHPTCGFNPLSVDAPADVIADYVVAALKNLFTDADIRASSDRYLRNATIAVLAHDRGASLWDAARLLSVGEEGYAYRRAVAARVRTMPELKEISAFFTSELTAQLADARAVTTSKLDAPVNKLARLLNSPSIKRVLLNDSLRVDFDSVIVNAEVLIVKGAMGAMGAGNTSVLMQLLVGMLDAALARQQDLVPAEQRTAVALKIDEAPLVINRGFAETMALKRSAGLETVACWQTDAQWVDREVRDQLDALFAHRVYFATPSARDARGGVALTMSEFSDTVRPETARLAALGRPDVRLRLPRHHAVVSWTTPEGRQPAFIAQTVPMQVDPARIRAQAEAQRERGGRHLGDLQQPHWDRAEASTEVVPAAGATEAIGTLQAADQPTTVALSRPHAAEPTAAALGQSRAAGDRLGALPEVPAASFRELVALDGAQSIRVAPSRARRPMHDPEQLDLDVLALVARHGHVLSSQIHRHFNPTRAATTTQRRLKRLADAGLVSRVQFHRRDGGGMPMCYAIAPDGRWLLEAREHPAALLGGGSPEASGARTGGRQLGQARHDVHVAGWTLALAALGGGSTRIHGAQECVLAPPRSPSAPTRTLLTTDLRLPGGRVPHDFLRTGAAGGRSEVERFETLRPDARLSLAPPAGAAPVDLLVERDDRRRAAGWVAKLERYDHFLSGWSAHTRRYGVDGVCALVIFVCRDRNRARECARAADPILSACRAYAGEYPPDWEYRGRRQIMFAAERDIHEGFVGAYAAQPLPPAVRVDAARGDPAAGEASPVVRQIPTGALG
jgi:Replication-relaxation